MLVLGKVLRNNFQDRDNAEISQYVRVVYSECKPICGLNCLPLIKVENNPQFSLKCELIVTNPRTDKLTSKLQMNEDYADIQRNIIFQFTLDKNKL